MAASLPVRGTSRRIPLGKLVETKPAIRLGDHMLAALCAICKLVARRTPRQPSLNGDNVAERVDLFQAIFINEINDLHYRNSEIVTEVTATTL